MLICTRLFSTEVEVWTACTRDLLSHMIEIFTSLSSQHRYSTKIFLSQIQVSAASKAAKHSAAKLEFTTFFTRLLCQAIGQYRPEKSITKMINPPCDPLSGRFAKLASQKATSWQVLRSSEDGNIRETLWLLILLTVLFTCSRSDTVGFFVELAIMQLKKLTSGLVCEVIQLICPMTCLISTDSSFVSNLDLSVPVFCVSISRILSAYPSLDKVMYSEVCLTDKPKYFKLCVSSTPMMNIFRISGRTRVRK